MSNLTDSQGAITWRSLSPGLKIMAFTFILQSTLSCLFLAWASQWIEISSGIIFLGPITEDPAEVTESIPSSSSERDQLDCFPRDVQWNDNKYKKDPVSFTCADFRYRIETFDESYADKFLGGRFPESKTLQELGCRSDAGRIVCTEEHTVERGRAAGVRAHRSWTASIVTPN
jgi:hypothetical protein